MRILIVDDDERLANILAVGLRAEGMTVVVFHSPLEALRHLEEVDVLLTDFHLPEMNGLEMAREAHAQGWRGSLFIMSGRLPDLDSFPQPSLCRATLEKPFPLHTLIELLYRSAAPSTPEET
jgi:DNA-binding response OmpR family regulator